MAEGFPICDTADLMAALRVLLVDDNPDFRAAAAVYLAAQPQFRLAGLAASGEEALMQVDCRKIDLVLLDLIMPGLSGIATLRCLKNEPAAPKVVIVTLQDAPEYRQIAHAFGADGFINKAHYTAELLPLVSRLFRDRVPPRSADAGALP